MYEDEVKKTKLTGIVTKANMGGISKSAHVGFILQQKSRNIKLRRDGANPLYDDYFEQFENKAVSLTGFDMQDYFLVITIKEITIKK
jgi:hypothetical protein